jgi:hypothetical protein
MFKAITAAIGTASLLGLGLVGIGATAAGASTAPGACHDLYVSYGGQVKTINEGYNPNHPDWNNTATVYKISAKDNGKTCVIGDPTVQVNLGGPTAELPDYGFGPGAFTITHGQTVSADITVQNPDNFLTNAFVRSHHHHFWFHGRRGLVEVVNPYSTAYVTNLNVLVDGTWHNLFLGWDTGITFEVGPNFTPFASVTPQG